MSENEIKPVAWVDLDVWLATNDAGDSFFTDYQDEDTVAVYDQSAIDRLTAERDAAVAQRDGYMEQHRRDSQELRSLCAQRDEAQRKLSVAVAEGKGLVAAAAEVCAWVKSGNDVPVDIDYVFRVQAKKIAADIRRLDAARAEGGV